MTAPDQARMTLTDDEQADLRNAHDTGWLTLLAHVTELCEAYRAQGYVMGDLAHDGTIQAQLEADVDPYDKVVFVQGHRHSEPVCAWPDCETYLTREQMAEMREAGE